MAAGLLVRTRVNPGAAMTRVGGAWEGPDGGRRLLVRVSAYAEKGKANAAVIAALADAFGLPKSAVRITAGDKSRLKSFMLEGDENALATRLAALLDG